MLAYLLYRTAQYVALNLPLKSAYAVAEFFADLKRLISPRDRRNVRFNLGIIANVSGREREAMVKQVFRNFGKHVVDFLRFPKVNEDFISRHVDIEGREHIDGVLKKGSAILLSAHLGSWELGGAAIGLLKYPVSVVALKHKSKYVTSLFESQRSSMGMEVIPLGGAWRRCLDTLKNGRALGLVGDRCYTNNGAWVEFFGRKAFLPKGPAVLSLTTGAPIVPIFLIRKKDDTFKLIFDKPIAFTLTNDKESNERILMGLCAKAMERRIKEHPDQWYVFRKFCEDKR